MSKLTDEEIRKMRELIADHDAEGSEEGDFDPSKVRVPYTFQKFPMMIYNHEMSYPAYDTEKNVLRGSVVVAEMVHVKAHLASKTVHTQRELEAALHQGWSESAPTFQEPEVEAEPEEQISVEEHRQRGRRKTAA